MSYVAIVHGPNLANVGQREPNIYGERSFDSYLSELRLQYPLLEIDYYQSNSEGALIDKLYELEKRSPLGILLNAGAYTHTSYALLDCIRALSIPVLELHISNIYARESFRQHSVIASACKGIISGFGLLGYRLGVEALLDINREEDKHIIINQ